MKRLPQPQPAADVNGAFLKGLKTVLFRAKIRMKGEV